MLFFSILFSSVVDNLQKVILLKIAMKQACIEVIRQRTKAATLEIKNIRTGKQTDRRNTKRHTVEYREAILADKQTTGEDR